MFYELDDLKLGKFDLHNIKGIEGIKFGYRLRLGRWRILFALFRKRNELKLLIYL